MTGQAYAIVFTNSATRDLQRLDRQAAVRIRSRLDWLAQNAAEASPKTLHGDLRGLLKLRVGDYRVVYTVDHARRTLSIHMVGHRREIYDVRWDD